MTHESFSHSRIDELKISNASSEDTCCSPDDGNVKILINLCMPCCSQSEKSTLDLSKLVMGVDDKDNLLNFKTRESTGLQRKECIESLNKAKDDLTFSDGKITGDCKSDPLCEKCIEAVNSAIVPLNTQLSYTSGGYMLSTGTYEGSDSNTYTII